MSPPKEKSLREIYIQQTKAQQEGERTLAKYAARLREHCEFSNTADERILEHIIQIIDDVRLIIRTIQKIVALVEILRRSRLKK